MPKRTDRKPARNVNRESTAARRAAAMQDAASMAEAGRNRPAGRNPMAEDSRPAGAILDGQAERANFAPEPGPRERTVRARLRELAGRAAGARDVAEVRALLTELASILPADRKPPQAVRPDRPAEAARPAPAAATCAWPSDEFPAKRPRGDRTVRVFHDPERYLVDAPYDPRFNAQLSQAGARWKRELHAYQLPRTERARAALWAAIKGSFGPAAPVHTIAG